MPIPGSFSTGTSCLSGDVKQHHGLNRINYSEADEQVSDGRMGGGEGWDEGCETEAKERNEEIKKYKKTDSCEDRA